ncbi:hypothetical protein FSP39_023377 [Pinctada imbricata]|uniref:Uncharacterized protein n=1 Tax=Pinctada imbricata TaxID=66713 RepID=A0AA88YUL7_PINIB|nr:hypothetical protein FSP39_023377 [Pinctada imbricata]
MRKSNSNIANVLENDDVDVDKFLSSGKSFSEYNRDRMSSFFETKAEAEERQEHTSNKIMIGKKKPKVHVGNLEKYALNREAFAFHMQSLPPGSTVIWSNLARQFSLKNPSGICPANGGQIMKSIAADLGIDTSKFSSKTTNLKEYYSRVRRARQTLSRGLRMPANIPTINLHKKVKAKLKSKEIDIGEEVAPKIYKTNKIDTTGELTERDVTIYGRKLPLSKLLRTMYETQKNLGVVRQTSNEEFLALEEEEVKKRFERIGEECPHSIDEARTLLHTFETQRHIKMWHDHSDILNHSYVCFMVSSLYDPAFFLTDAEFSLNNPTRKSISVQAIVEKPMIYLLGQSKSSDVDQLSYTATRVEDLKNALGNQTSNVLRVFSGDGPARQFEAGHQRGGNYSCLCRIPS